MARVIVEIDDPFGLSQNKDSLPLLLGSFVTVDIASERELTAVTIPRTALLEGDKVMVVNKDNRLEIRDVEIVWREQDTVFTSSGLRAEDRVIKSRISRPIAGMLLKVLGDEVSDPPQATAPKGNAVTP